MPTLSVIVPVYNEVGNISGVIKNIDLLPLDKEIIVVNDSSSDGTDRILNGLHYPNLKIIHHSSNRGKGAAVITGLAQATGEYVIVQDADFEYDPKDYFKLIDAMKKECGDLILGARFTEGYHGMKIPRIGNRFLTNLMNILFGVKLNDCFTCYKLMRRRDLLALSLGSKSFDIEIEILAKAIKKRMRIAEIPVYYKPRDYSQGKKIKVKDGIWAVLMIFKFRLI
ncbi:MAG TPA: glycosyltransferase family 2 protein [Candidatus Omnitrophota bacterium]|nr:glycosyltransferase family 2 protein [Candidatus Omnitrophota bacterium]